MEDKLLELKDQFCKWYCPNREKELTIKDWCANGAFCSNCKTTIRCNEFYQINVLCEHCMVGEFIRHIRDEL